MRSLERDLFPYIGKLPISTIKTPLMLDVLQQIEKRGALEITRRLASLASAIFKYATVKGLMEYDPIAALKAEPKPRVKGCHAAIKVTGSSICYKLAAEIVLKLSLIH